MGTGIETARLQRVKAWTAHWVSPFTAPVPERIEGALIRLQHERLIAALPILCLLIAANSLAMAGAILGDLPWWQQAAPPAILIASCLLVFVRLRGTAKVAHESVMLARLRCALLIVTPLGLVAGAWAINAFVETERYYCMVAPVFIGIAALVAATMLTAVPRAAIAAMVATVAPLAIKLATYDNFGLRAMAAMLVLLTIMLAKVVLEKFRETVSMLSYQTELDQLASTDPLTGLANRRAFHDQLELALGRAEPVTLLLFDLDGFKIINDRHGHAAGDAVLNGIASHLIETFPAARCRARLGGDEFAVLLHDGAGACRAKYGQHAAAMSVSIEWDGVVLSVGASCGIAHAPADAQRSDALLACADLRLYRDKQTRRMPSTTSSELRLAVNG
jgi:diguanylate cyclase (GGDEF)-like protein